ncbi:hypothetical protein [Myxococcus landrumensis]|uniref:AsmA-like C-terminal domain-containing protein n=1 Tax=Myxococcus landrumensis TaxID=2813577 RepID=A0ABX7N4J1_9BACT|nr:hypothetical protein [Myxococcus landrumus]QSQ13378.1 hypothetical protein JY572_34370 [Myxococcus landrumus]
MSNGAPQSSREAPKARARRRGWRRVLLWTLGALVLFEVLINVLLNVGFVSGLLKRETERTRIEWSGGWWLWPGPVHLRDFSVLQRDAATLWQVKAESVRAQVSLAQLLSRRVSAHAVVAQGVRAWARPAPPLEQPVPHPPSEHPWQIILRGVELEDVRELAWEPVRYLGTGNGRGSLHVVAGQRLNVDLEALRLGDGLLEMEERRMGRVKELTASVNLDSLQHPHGQEPRHKRFDGTFGVKLDVEDLGWLGALLSRGKEHAIHLSQGAGHVDAEVHVRDGRFAEGSRVDASGAALELKLGPARVRAPWSVNGAMKGTQGQLRLRFAPVQLEGAHGHVLEIPEVQLTLHDTNSAQSTTPHVAYSLHMAKSHPVDLRMLNAWMGKTFHVESGHATLEGTDTSAEEQVSRVRLHAETDLVEGRWSGIRVLGKTRADVDAQRVHLHGKSLALDGTRLDIDHVSADTKYQQIRGWSGSFHLTRARLSLEPVELETDFTATFANSAPFVAMLTTEKKLPRFLSPMLEAKNWRITGHARMGDAGLQLRKLHAKAEGLELEGRMDTARGTTHALLLAKMGGLTGAVEVAPGRSHVQVKGAQRWYEEQLARPPGQEGTP